MKFFFRWLTFTVGLAIIGVVIAAFVLAWNIIGPFNRTFAFIIGVLLLLAGGVCLCIVAIEEK